MFKDVTPGRRRIMRTIMGKDTGPELALRMLLHRSGYRFRLHRRDLPGTPDIVFRSRRAAILMHGCFWHQGVTRRSVQNRTLSRRIGA